MPVLKPPDRQIVAAPLVQPTLRTDPAPVRRLPGSGRILFLAPEPFCENRSTPITIRGVLQALSELGHVVDLVTFPTGEPVELRGLEVIRVGNPFGIRSVPIGFSAQKAHGWMSLFPSRPPDFSRVGATPASTRWRKRHLPWWDRRDGAGPRALRHTVETPGADGEEPGTTDSPIRPLLHSTSDGIASSSDGRPSAAGWMPSTAA